MILGLAVQNDYVYQNEYAVSQDKNTWRSQHC